MDYQIKKKIIIAALWAIFFLVGFCYSLPINQPDIDYYGSRRNELLNASESILKTFPIRWIVASSKEGVKVYSDSSMNLVMFTAPYLQRFEVFAKEKSKLEVKELDSPTPRAGWVNMRDLIYLSIALKDETMGVYQKVVFTHMEEHIKLGKIRNITFYKGPFENNPLVERAMGTLRIAYVYAWDNSTYDDSKYVLIGKSPFIDGASFDNAAFKKSIYGWCKLERLFPWNSRLALIPNKIAEYPAYIFLDGPELTNFYENPQINSAPRPQSLLTYDSFQMWINNHWPFFLQRKIVSGEQEYLRLICQVDVSLANLSGFSVDQLQKELEGMKASTKEVDIVFLLDATKSMGPYIEGVAKIVKDIMDELRKNSSIDRLRFGAAVYRDYVDREKKFEIEPLTQNINELTDRLNVWAKNASSHPDDNGEAAYPEALFNGISEALKRSGYGEFNSKFLIILGDAGNNSRGNDNFSRESIGDLLASYRINCMMMKVKHELVGGAAEKIATELFKTDAEGIRESYLRKYSNSAKAHNVSYTQAEILKFFLTDEIENPFKLKNQLLNRYSKQISDSINKMIEDYQSLIEGGAIVAPETTNRLIINPIIFESLKARFENDFQKVFEELKQNRAFIMKLGYAKEYDPRSPSMPQFKNVYLLSKSEVGGIIEVLDRTVRRLKTKMVKNLWMHLIEGVYGEDYEPARTFNDYLKMRDGITYKNLSVLFDKTEEQIDRLQSQELEEIYLKVWNVMEKLKNLFRDKQSERFFGPLDDPYIWLYEDEMP